MIGPVGHGIAKYVQLLARGLRSLREQPGGLLYDLEFLVAPGVRIEGMTCIETAIPFLDLREWIEIPRLLMKQKAALYHSPSFSSLPWSPCPWVVTVHDLNHLQYGGWLKKQYYGAILKKFVRGARAVMTVSEFSRDEIQRWLGSDSPAPQIVWNPIEPPSKNETAPDSVRRVMERWKLQERKYWLCMAGWKPHKNLSMLLRAYAEFRGLAVNSPPQLCVAAEDREPGANPGVVFLAGISDADIQVLLSHAQALFSPSIYEGFGRPPLESLVRGVPVVVSDISPHREGLRGQAASGIHWVESQNERGWSSAMSTVSRGEIGKIDPHGSEELLRRFSPEKCAQDLDRVYKSALE